jgi:hypothetical protein
MSSSTILAEDLDEKQLSAPRPDLLVRTESNLEKAIDAEAHLNISPASDDTVSDEDPGPPPNGGLQAWLQVLGSFFLFFNSWYVGLDALGMKPTDLI